MQSVNQGITYSIVPPSMGLTHCPPMNNLWRQLGKLQKPCSLEEYLPSVDSNIAFISGRIEFVSISASHEVVW